MVGITATRRETVQPRPNPPQPGLASWPLRAGLDLGAVPTAPGCGRAWTRAILWEWRLIRLADQAELISSELLTNALLASRWLDRPAIGLTLLSDGRQLVILVRDFNPSAPVPRQADAEEESGRGLMLVEAISDRFGWERPADGTPGKFVWAVLQLVHKPIGGAPPAMSGLVRLGNAARPAAGPGANWASADLGVLRQIRAALDRL